ncbi:Uncharacterized protein TCAP_05512 [Tolypocladium capitatum]|uniref:DUF3752 domain-containing protein n=1 Tax=Tolypocladium capitatum TaxID=45235 RepID=A0A2K3QAL7_9HYPO|nr:Uncharacterized protein TCAP_05512 [Tolypocladium capitatum]
MSSIGPRLPAQLSKRKRTPDGDDNAPKPASPPSKHPRREGGASTNFDEMDRNDLKDDDGGGGSGGPSAPPAVGPSLPPTANNDEIDLSDSDSDTGPAPPPQPQPKRHPLPQRQPQPQPPPAEPDSSDSDSDYGPSLPSATTKRAAPIGPSLPSSEPTPQRDSWMLAPPTSSGYTERDPTRMRNRKFASKPSAAPKTAVGLPSIWTETPEEKLRRLQDSVLGRADAAADAAGSANAGGKKSKEEEERGRRIAASIEARRGKSLYDEHSTKRRDRGADKGEEDDPSQRAFDREKDMALGGKIGTAKRRELVTKSANFGGRFQKGSYL